MSEDDKQQIQIQVSIKEIAPTNGHGPLYLLTIDGRKSFVTAEVAKLIVVLRAERDQYCALSQSLSGQLMEATARLRRREGDDGQD